MTPADLLSSINSATSLRQFVEEHLLTRIPWIFQNDTLLYSGWRADVARAAGVNANAIYLVGSAATGYSLSPTHPGRAFRPVTSASVRPSDIDIAIVDSKLFELAWNTVIKFDRRGGLSRLIRETYGYDPERINSDLSEMRRNVYWGAISHAYAVSGTQFAQVLLLLFAATTRSKPFVGHPPKARIYRRREDLVSYHEQSLQVTKENLIRRSVYL